MYKSIYLNKMTLMLVPLRHWNWIKIYKNWNVKRSTHCNDDNKVTDDVRNVAHTLNMAITPIYKILSSTTMPSYPESPQNNQSLISDNLYQENDSSANISGTKVSYVLSLVFIGLQNTDTTTTI